MEVKSVCSPGTETDEKEYPISQTELSEESDGVRQRFWGLPLCVSLASELVRDDDSLLPAEEILNTLPSRS